MFACISLLIMPTSMTMEFDLKQAATKSDIIFTQFIQSGSASGREAIAKEIANSPPAAIHFLANTQAVQSLKEADRTYILKFLQDKQLLRNKLNSNKWAAEKRLDLLIESAGIIGDDTDRKIFTDALLGIVASMKIVNENEGGLSKTNFQNESHHRWRDIDRSPGGSSQGVYGPNVELVAKVEHRKLVIAGSINLRASVRRDCIFISRDRIVEQSPYNEWQTSIIVTNAALPDSHNVKFSDCIVIVDGDFDCTGSVLLDKCTFIINGFVKSSSRIRAL